MVFKVTKENKITLSVKWTVPVCIFSLRKMGRAHFELQKKKGQGTFWAAGKWAGCYTFLKMPKGNTNICYFVLLYA